LHLYRASTRVTFEPPLANERGFFNESEPKIDLKTTDR